MPKSKAELERDFDRAMALIADLTMRFVVVDVKLAENRNCEKSSEKAMTKLERLYSSKEGTAVNAVTLRRI